MKMACPFILASLLLCPWFGQQQVVFAETPVNGLTEAEKRSGWQLLFDGKTTNGWRNFRKDTLSEHWAIKEGAIQWMKKGAGDLITTQQFDYFELSLEYRISEGGNSGIMFHVTEELDTPWKTGPEVQVQDNLKGHDPQKSGWLHSLYKPLKPEWSKEVEAKAGYKGIDMDDSTRPAGQWNHVYLRIAEQQCEVAINGVSYYYFKKGDEEWDERVAKSKFAQYPQFGKSKKGHICLQDHGDVVAFRNIKIRELSHDGVVPDPSDGTLSLAGADAFPKLQWKNYETVDDQGRFQPLRPMCLTHANDGSNRVFVGTQGGVIHVFDNHRDEQETQIFLDIKDQVFDWQKENEEGLLGLAFDPHYKDTGAFYVYYSSEPEPRTSIISRFLVSKDNPNQADPESEEIILKLPQPFSNHNGGAIAFGPDGYLYIALGDGGSRNDPIGNGQDLTSLMGSILRVDVHRKDGSQAYGIPSDNPFLKTPGAKPEIFAYGFRNIWRMSFDRKTGALWAGDVGQDLWEEINLVRKGGNYGWNIREGSYLFGNGTLQNQERPQEPVWEYDHQIGKCITGGFVYRGTRVPELQGAYLYADFITGRIWALYYDEIKQQVIRNMRIPTGETPVLAFGEDEAGEVYYLLETIGGQGIFRFEPTP